MELFGWPKKHLQLLFLLAVTIKTLESSKMKITGKVTVPSLQEGVSLAKESYLTVKFEDTGMMDVASIVLGKQEQKLTERTNVGPGAVPLNYTIVCDKPEKLYSEYSVSAVLNVGWKASGDEWLRKGDFMTDTIHTVDVTEESDHVVADIELVHYNY